MNAAFLLVTTAWLAGAEPPPAPVKPMPAPPGAPVYSAATGACCGNTSDCDSGGGHRLFGCFRGLFHRGDGCETTSNACDGGSGHRLFGGLHGHGDCGDTCDGGGHRMFGWFKGLFHRGEDCCDSTADCCGGATPAPIRAEPIPAPRGTEPPRRMPEAPEAPKKSVRGFTPEPALAPVTTRVFIEE